MDREDIDDIVRRIANTFDPHTIIVFGSVAKGTADENSDLDLLVIMDSDLPRIQRSIDVKMSLGNIKIPLDLLVFTPEEIDEEKDDRYSIVSEAFRSGEIVYGSA